MNQRNGNSNTNFTDGYKRYVLFILFIIYIFNFADRYILISVQTYIKNDLGLSDLQLGAITGFWFALFYTVAGIPIARWADRSSRTTIMSLGITIWSALTAVCGLAQNYIHLLFARIGVGVGEATATPCSHSIISDLFPPEKRGKALGIYSIGANVGMFLGMALGGIIAKELGWRYAFYIVGLPGVIMAIILKLTVKEPPRGLADNLKDKIEDKPLGETFSYLFSLKSFRNLCIAGSVAGMAGFGVIHWSNVFLERSHNMKPDEIGFWLGFAMIIGGVSTILGGLISDRLSKKTRKWYMRVPAIGMLGMLPFLYIFLFYPNKIISIIGIYLAFLIGLLYTAPTFSIVQGLAKPNMRALASAIFLFLVNLIGMGIGPTLVGLISDLLEPTLKNESIRYALLIMSIANIWAAIHYIRASQKLPEELDLALET